MKIVLRDDVENLGRKGDVVDVADGYARNFLVPRGLAMKATKGVVEQAEAMRRNRAAREVRDREAAQAAAAAIAGMRLEIAARAGLPVTDMRLRSVGWRPIGASTVPSSGSGCPWTSAW